MAERVRNFQISDRAKLGLAGILAVFVAAFLGALLALAIDGNGDGDHHSLPGAPFGMAAGGPPGAQSGAVPGGASIDPSQGGGFPGAPDGSFQGGMPVPPTGSSRGFPEGEAAPPSLPAIPNQQGRGSGQSGNQSGQGSSN